MIDSFNKFSNKENELLSFYNAYFKIKAITDTHVEYEEVEDKNKMQDIIQSSKPYPIPKNMFHLDKEYLTINISYKLYMLIKEKFPPVQLKDIHKEFMKNEKPELLEQSLFKQVNYFLSLKNNKLSLTDSFNLFISLITSEFSFFNEETGSQYIQYYPIYGLYLNEIRYIEKWENIKENYKIKLSINENISMFSNKFILKEFFDSALYEKEDKDLTYIANGVNFSNFEEYLDLLEIELNKHKKKETDLKITSKQCFFWPFDDPFQNPINFDYIIKEGAKNSLKEYLINDFTENEIIDFDPYFGTYTKENPLAFGQHEVLINNQNNKVLNPVVGAPGTGKTTLFKSIYANNITKRVLSLIEFKTDINNCMLMVSTANKIINAVYQDMKEVSNMGGMLTFITTNNKEDMEKNTRISNFDLDKYIKYLEDLIYQEFNVIVNNKSNLEAIIIETKKLILFNWDNINFLKKQIKQIFLDIDFLNEIEILYKSFKTKDLLNEIELLKNEINELEIMSFLEYNFKNLMKDLNLNNNLLNKYISILNDIEQKTSISDIDQLFLEIDILYSNYEDIKKYNEIKKITYPNISDKLISIYKNKINREFIFKLTSNPLFDIYKNKAFNNEFEQSIFKKIKNLFNNKFEQSMLDVKTFLQLDFNSDINLKELFFELNNEKEISNEFILNNIFTNKFNIIYNQNLFDNYNNYLDINKLKTNLNEYEEVKKNVNNLNIEKQVFEDKFIATNKKLFFKNFSKQEILLRIENIGKYISLKKEFKSKLSSFVNILNINISDIDHVKKEMLNFLNLKKEDIFRTNGYLFYKPNYKLFRLSELFLAYTAKEYSIDFNSALKRMDHARGGPKLENGRKSLNNEDMLLISLIFPILGTTTAKINKMNSSDIKNFRLNIDFESVIVDEAGMISSGDLIHSLNISKRAIIVGDPKQLKSISNIPESIKPLFLKITEKDLYFFKKYSPSEVSSYHRAAGSIDGDISFIGSGVLLNEHRRCQEDIANFFKVVAKYPSDLKICTNKLKSPYDIKLPYYEKELRFKNIEFYNVILNQESEEKNTNKDEILKISEILDILQNKYNYDLTKDIGIITPFNNQANKLISEFGIKIQHNSTTPKIGTVHKFQGAEFPVIIFSSVLNKYSSGFDFVCNNMPLLNVSISRAKNLYIHVGDYEVLKGKSELINTYLQFIENNGIIK